MNPFRFLSDIASGLRLYNYIPAKHEPAIPEEATGPSDRIVKQGWSKELGDCHERLRKAYPMVEAEFSASHPGCKLRLDYTWRSKEFQFELFKKGREMQNGEWVIVDKSKVVTQKDGSKQSHHQSYPAQALDHYIVRNGSIVWPDDKNLAVCSLYADLGDIWNKHDIISGATWKWTWHDWGHCQVDYKIL